MFGGTVMPTKGKILIVDDDPDFVKTTKMILIADGYEVVVAEDAKQGLQKIKESQPHLVILDIMMESMFEGFSFLSVLRTAPEYDKLKTTPILMVSSVKTDTGSRFSFEDAEDMGDSPQPDDYMDKPLKAKQLLEKVVALIRRRT
jgi:DNA-binding response OmpR family regulator